MTYRFKYKRDYGLTNNPKFIISKIISKNVKNLPRLINIIIGANSARVGIKSTLLLVKVQECPTAKVFFLLGSISGCAGLCYSSISAISNSI